MVNSNKKIEKISLSPYIKSLSTIFFFNLTNNAKSIIFCKSFTIVFTLRSNSFLEIKNRPCSRLIAGVIFGSLLREWSNWVGRGIGFNLASWAGGSGIGFNLVGWTGGSAFNLFFFQSFFLLKYCMETTIIRWRRRISWWWQRCSMKF